MAHADDELLSALLDGEPAPGDAAHVDVCDECQARMTALRTAATAMATPVTPPPGHVREAAFREAMLEVDGARKATGRARVLPFGRRSTTGTSGRRPNPFSAVAALLVAVVIGGWALSNIETGGNDNGTLATGSTNAIAADAGGAAFSLDREAAAPAGRDGGNLGAVDDIAAIQRSYEFATTQRGCCAGDTKVATITHCPIPDGASLLFHAELNYKGETAVAHVVQIGDANPATRILRLPDCSLIASQEFAPTTQR